MATTPVLNPHAPIFIPSAYRAVEDFSDEWWDLVQSSPWFRDYWLRECYADTQIDNTPIINIDDFALTDEITINNTVDSPREVMNINADLVALGLLNWRKHRGTAPKYGEKAPKIVNVKVNPKPIQQPR